MIKIDLKKNIFLKSKFSIFLRFLFNFVSKLETLTKPIKTFLLLGLDFTLVIISYNLTNFFFKGIEGLSDSYYLGIWVIPIMIFISSLFFLINGEYLSISKYIRSSEIYNILKRNFILIFIAIIIGFIFNFKVSYFQVYFLFWINISFLNIFGRFSLKEILTYSRYLNSRKINRVAIYGAGAAGAQLASSLILAASHKIYCFFDDSENLWGRKLLGIEIYSSKDIFRFKNKIDQILFAIPSLNKDKSMRILKQIKEQEIPVLKVPSIKDLTTGNLSINSLRPIEIEDLLGRVTAEPNQKLLKDSIENLNICITGAGGSIGKEIFKQIVSLNPKSILLIDSNEFSLYSLEQEIEDIFGKINNLNINLKLGDVKDFNLIKKLFLKYQVDVVFHSAAYKHVPLIEQNPLQGIENNILSTFAICSAAEELNLSKVTLISTDKAVRPTNIMGATKRFSELILQSFADKITNHNLNLTSKAKSKNIRFSIVRFGNVLGSSGSVVPLFKKQIASGGPITLTDERIIRYFMTTTEAAQLVIQATSLSQGGDVFVLDMGEPLRIKELAEQMIRLSGLKVKSKNNQNGDIEIITTGLRPGEKLYEELLIEGELLKPPHPLIFRANEEKMPYEEIFAAIPFFRDAITNLDEDKALYVLSKFVPEWKKNY